MVKATKEVLPRGFRNNNPLNIRIGNVWLGEVLHPSDPNFEQFISMKYGLRAAFVLLRRYIWHYKRQTIAAIISAWAPSNENNTNRYIDMVSQLMGIAPDAPIDYSDKDTMVKLVQAMCVVENGRPLPDEKLIHQAYEMA